jgi:hypothetical protein
MCWVKCLNPCFSFLPPPRSQPPHSQGTACEGVVAGRRLVVWGRPAGCGGDFPTSPQQRQAPFLPPLQPLPSLLSPGLSSPACEGVCTGVARPHVGAQKKGAGAGPEGENERTSSALGAPFPSPLSPLSLNSSPPSAPSSSFGMAASRACRARGTAKPLAGVLV